MRLQRRPGRPAVQHVTRGRQAGEAEPALLAHRHLPAPAGAEPGHQALPSRQQRGEEPELHAVLPAADLLAERGDQVGTAAELLPAPREATVDDLRHGRPGGQAEPHHLERRECRPHPRLRERLVRAVRERLARAVPARDRPGALAPLVPAAPSREAPRAAARTASTIFW